MRALFVYGTLLDGTKRAAVFGAPPIAAGMRPATLSGYRRVYARGASYPVLVRARGAATRGLLIAKLPARAWRRLFAYEGSGYRLARVRVTAADGRAAWARVFLARTLGATTRAWPPSTSSE